MEASVYQHHAFTNKSFHLHSLTSEFLYEVGVLFQISTFSENVLIAYQFEKN